MGKDDNLRGLSHLEPERAAFEKWFSRAYHQDQLQPMESGCYLNLGAGMAWDAWQHQQNKINKIINK